MHAGLGNVEGAVQFVPQPQAGSIDQQGGGCCQGDNLLCTQIQNPFTSICKILGCCWRFPLPPCSCTLAANTPGRHTSCVCQLAALATWHPVVTHPPATLGISLSPNTASQLVVVYMFHLKEGTHVQPMSGKISVVMTR
jgi:hypothetical protein